MERILHNRILGPDITDRLDPQYYGHEVIANEKLLANFNEISLEDHVDLSIDNAIADLTSNGSFEFLRGIEFNDKDGIKFLRTQNIYDGYIDDSDLTYVSNSSASKVAKSLCRTGDLVVCRKGKVGATSAVPECFAGAAISENLTVFKLQEQFDADYIAAFLNSKQGRMRFNRESTGVVQKWINNEKLRQIKIVNADPVVQKYIGNKVRQAERSRSWAKDVQTQIQEAMPAYQEQVASYENKFFKSARSELSQLRLDPSFYHPDHIELDNKLRAVGCNRLGNKCVQVKAAWNKNAENFFYFEIGGLNVSNGTIETSLVDTDEAPSRAKTGIQLGDVLVSTVRPNRKNVAFVIEDFSPLPMVATSGFSVLRFPSLERAAFYHAWLRSQDATHQLMRWNSGSAYPAIDDDVPLSILVPEFDERFVSEWGTKALSSHYALIAAKKLVRTAKLLVEALIEGQLTEQQLIHAQKALDTDDNNLDRDILSRLTTKGLESDGDPLFTDLDQLYDLLAQSQQTDQ